MGTVEVYADLLFLINAGMDGLCFCLTAKLLHLRMRGRRVLISSAVGGVYAVLALLFDVGQGLALLLDVAVCILLTAIAFVGKRGCGMRRLPAATAVFLAISMVMGGVMTALYNLLNRMGATEWLPAGEDGLTAWLFVLLAVVGSAISLKGGRFFRRSVDLTSCTVTLTVGEDIAMLHGMVDTGNRLRDPVGGRAVICADVTAMSAALPPNCREAIRVAVRDGHPDKAIEAASSAGLHLRLIPTETATGNSLLVALRPDRLSVTVESRRRQEEREVDAVVALSGSLSDTEALVPAELVG